MDANDRPSLPVLEPAPDPVLAGVVADMQRRTTADPTPTGADCGCGCGHGDEPESLRLDVRDVPHAIRHATVFGALGAVPAGSALELVAPHDPLPLLAQIEQREPGRYAVAYLERGPEAWRLTLTRLPG